MADLRGQIHHYIIPFPTDGHGVSLEEDVPGVPYVTITVSLREGFNFSRQSLVVGVSGVSPLLGERNEYICTATNDNNNATNGVNVFINVPSLGSLEYTFQIFITVCICSRCTWYWTSIICTILNQ